MRRNRPPRSGMQRLAVISLALATMLLGYFLGNRYQLDELRNSAAIVYEQPRQIESNDLPEPLRRVLEDTGQWVVLLPGEPGPACDALLNQYIEVVNRLAAWPAIQSRIRLTLIDPGASTAPSLLWQGVPWADAIAMPNAQMLQLTGELGIAPLGTRWCQDVQATAALLGPGAQSPGLLPLDKPADMAESLRLIIQTFDPDV